MSVSRDVVIGAWILLLVWAVAVIVQWQRVRKLRRRVGSGE